MLKIYLVVCILFHITKNSKMGFPYSYNKKIEFINNDLEFTSKEIINKLIFSIKNKNITNLEFINNNISFLSKDSLFKLEYKLSIAVEYVDNDIDIYYSIDMNRLAHIILILVIILAFFSFVTVKMYLILASIFVFSFYYVNLFFIKSYIENIIYDVIGFNNKDLKGSDFFSKRQLEWINNPTKCSACGHEITNIDLHCPDCGIRVKPKNWIIPIDTTKYKDKIVKYHYRK